MLCIRVTLKTLHLISFNFNVDILGVFFDGFKICFQKKWISVRIDCSKDYCNESSCSVSTEVL